MTTSKWQRLKQWWQDRIGAFMWRWIVKRGIELQVEARHGAFRTRHKERWKGGLVRVDIPLQKQQGVTDTPMGRISTEEAKKLIDAFTGLEGEDPFNELRPSIGPDKLVRRSEHLGSVCAACGQKIERRGLVP